MAKSKLREKKICPECLSELEKKRTRRDLKADRTVYLECSECDLKVRLEYSKLGEDTDGD